MDESPVTQLLAAIDKLDVGAAMAVMAPECRLLTVDGRWAVGPESVRVLLSDFMAMLRSSSHQITAQWHPDDVWIAEVEATYELQDWLRMESLRRVFVARDGPDGVVDLRVYGAHERPLADHRTGEEGMRIGDRWIPPL
jgi:hypothetical protein